MRSWIFFLVWTAGCSDASAPLEAGAPLDSGAPLDASADVDANDGPVSVSPSTLTFASQDVDTSSAPQYVTVTNHTSAAIVITSVVGGNDFAYAGKGTCAGELAGGASCTISVRFRPLAIGSRAGSLTVGASIVALSGVGVDLAGGQGTTYYVATNAQNASDNNAGSEAAPWKTIQKAADVAMAGDTVLVDDGVYTSTTGTYYLAQPKHAGSANAWITFRSRNKWGAVLDGQFAATPFYGFDISATGTSYIRVQDFEMRNFSKIDDGAGISVHVDHVEIIGNDIHHVGKICTDTNEGFVGIYVHNTDSVMISRNRIHDIGRYSNGENGCVSTINNFTHDHAIYVDGDTNLVATNNLFYNNNHGSPIVVWSDPSAGAVPSANVTIANNTFLGANVGGISGDINLSWPSVTNGVVRNNIFYGPTDSGVFVNPYTPTNTPPVFTNVSIDHNLTFGQPTVSGLTSGVNVSANLDKTDPMFVDATTFDVRLLPNSPAIDSGVTVSQVSEDIDALARPVGLSYDIGAVERATN